LDRLNESSFVFNSFFLEIVNPNCGHDLNVDWWSVGVLIIELLTGQSPFSREGEESNQQVISERIQNSPPTIPEIVSYWYFNFCKQFINLTIFF